MDTETEKIAMLSMGDTKSCQKMSGDEVRRDIQLRQQAKELEAIFLTQMIKAMRKTVPKNPWTESDNNLPNLMFESVMGKAMAGKGGLGLSKLIYDALRDMDQATLEKLRDLELEPDLRLINSAAVPQVKMEE